MEHKNKKCLCVYCETEIPYNIEKRICDNHKCNVLFKYQCKKILSCGHNCFLSSTAKNCLCLIENCKKNLNDFFILKQNQVKNKKLIMEFLHEKLFSNEKEENYSDSQYCLFCTELLFKFPVVKLDCNHFFHHKCLNELFQSNKIEKGDEISFGFLRCPLCLKQIELSNHGDLNCKVEYYKCLIKKIEEIIYLRIEKDDLLNHKEILNEDSKYFIQPVKFGWEKFSFFLCYKCEEPYYGGLKFCGLNNNDEENKEEIKEKKEEEVGNNLISSIVSNENDDLNQNIIEEIRSKKVCLNCIDSNLVQGKLDCNLHGRESILFKCRFCCSESSHFCWGTTHFCEECHLKNLKGELKTDVKYSELSKCVPNKCFLKGNHASNGLEYAYGCEVCLSIENQSEKEK